CLRLGPSLPRTTFGIAPHADAADRLGCLMHDAVDCPQCGGELQYDFRRFFHLGRVRCPHGDFVTPPIDVECIAADAEANTLTVRTADGDETYPLPTGDVLDRYAFTAAIALCRTAHLCSVDALRRAVTDDRTSARPVTLLYVKEQSPVSCSRALRAVANTDRPTAVLLMTEHLADAIRSSENMLWLYESECARLHTDLVRHIVLTGARTADWRVRLLLCGIEDDRITAVRHAIDADSAFPLTSVQRVFILYNTQNADAAYTAYDRLMSRMSGREEVSL
ncbi:MAG: DUF1727 domain-containing protein, partial [Clostridia bacterium]|nr:DUF1727 domain-containing protein [Clostridia bacterium]